MSGAKLADKNVGTALIKVNSALEKVVIRQIHK